MATAAGDPRPRLGGVEAGGTKVVCVIGRGPGDIDAETRINVTDPAATLGAALQFFRAAADRGLSIEALGIGSFGPVSLRPDAEDYGRITTTPKPGWSGTDMVRPFRDALDVPVTFDTDVNAAALAEGEWGAGRGLRSFVYLTVGTGIGGGAIVDGRLLRGMGHPEMGHIAVPRRTGDAFPGVCPFHGDCLEGMASGPATAARFGRRAEDLGADDRAAAGETVGWYLAAGIASLVYALAPERVVLGGGVSHMAGLIDTVQRDLADRLREYPALAAHGSDSFLVAAGLGGLAGPLGTLLLAGQGLR